VKLSWAKWAWALAAVSAAGATLAIARPGHASVLGLPTNAQFKVFFVTPRDPQAYARSFAGYQFFWQGENAWGRPDLLKRILGSTQNEFARRRATLPADATLHAGDRYSKQAFAWPYYHGAVQGFGMNVPAQTVQVVIDEFGRTYDIDYAQRGALAGLWANPLFQVVLAAALAASGYGAVAYAAYTAYNMRGQKLTLKNVALQTARAYAVSQCGQACGAAFDMGVGIASGQRVDAAAVSAFESQLTPEQRATYERAKDAYRKSS
jgi:hypothetical protein